MVIAILSLVVVIAGTVLMVLGGSRVGATWDERIHALMTETYFATGWYASPDWLVDGGLDPFTGKWPYFVYAPVASLIAHAAAVLTGNEGWGGFSDSASAHAARHLGTAFIAFLGIVAAGLITRLITRSWRWAVVAGAVLASTPMWIGHGMFNVKDLPVGAGYTIATIGLVAMLRRDYARRPWLRVGAWASIVIGVVMAVGTRPASGLPIALTGLGLAATAVVLILLGSRRPHVRSWGLWPRVIDPVGALLVGYLALVAIYPNGFINPFRLVKETLLISGRFPVNDPELTNGVWLTQPPPWYYLPTWFGAQLTLLTLVGVLVFAVAWVLLVVRVVRQRPRRAARLEAAILPVPVLAQLLLLPLLAILVKSTMYDAVRQFLFVVPAAAVLATLGVRAAARRLREPRWAWVVLWSAVAVGLVVPVVDQVRLFPYTYAYFNEITTMKPVNGNWATDYWRASGRDLVRLIPAGDTSCILVEDDKPARPCDQDASFEPFWADRGADAQPGVLGTGQYWLVRENGGDLTVPDGCTLHDQITRPLKGQELVIGQVLRCTAPVGG